MFFNPISEVSGKSIAKFPIQPNFWYRKSLITTSDPFNDLRFQQRMGLILHISSRAQKTSLLFRPRFKKPRQTIPSPLFDVLAYIPIA